MAHEITSTDGLVLHRQTAWHGLGLVVDDAPTPQEALVLAGLDWTVKQKPLIVQFGKERQIVETHVANYRDQTLLGVVSAGYVPVQNQDMADFADALLDDGQVKVETAGSIRGGRKTWFLLKGDEFSVAKGDAIFPYILVSNSHDGTATFRVTPTTVRVVCSNTLHMVVPRTDSGELVASAISVRHTKNIHERVAEAKTALAQYGRALKETRSIADIMAEKSIKTDGLFAFFNEAYSAAFQEIPTNPKNAKEERAKERAKSAFLSFSRRFDDERGIAGTGVWNAFNAFSGMVQHDLKARGADDADRVERRVYQNLFGLNQDRTQSAFRLAFALVS